MLAQKKIEPQTNRRARAFTLVELLVAITAGLFVALGAFALAKQGSRFFQQEARVSNAQFSAALGFDRLRADIARAGFLSTGNIQRDPFYCGPRPSGAPAGITSLAAVRIVKAVPADAQDSTNGLFPDQIWLSGSYSSPETFPVRSIFENGTAFNVYLQPNNGATARAGGAEGGSLAQIFTAGRMLRILDSTGRYEFGEIQGYALDASGDMVVTLKQTPPIAFKRDGVCGVEGFGVGMQANVVNWIKYEVRNLKANIPTGYQALYGDAATAPGDETRLDLVRVEVGADESELSVELVAEYAVDLKFGLTVASDIVAGTDPTTSVFPIGDDRNYEYTYKVAPPAPADQKGPERIRTVRARLAVRSREADRAADIPISPATGNIFRYSFGVDAGYARTRTITADIGLPNLANLKW